LRHGGTPRGATQIVEAPTAQIVEAPTAQIVEAPTQIADLSR